MTESSTTVQTLALTPKTNPNWIDRTQQFLHSWIPRIPAPVTGSALGLCTNGDTTPSVEVRGTNLPEAAARVEAMCRASKVQGTPLFPNIDRMTMIVSQRPDLRHDMEIIVKCVHEKDRMEITGYPDAEIPAPLPTPDAVRAMGKEIEERCQGQGI